MSSMKDDKGYRDQIRLKAKNDFNQDLTEDHIDMCIYSEEQERLSFFHGHLYINPRRIWVNGGWQNKVQWSKTIDGYRVLAQRNGLCRIDEPDWEYGDDGELMLCKVSVWRRGPDGYPEGPFVGIAHYREFVQLADEYKDKKKTGAKVPNRQWKTSPLNQLSVCAERQAHRKAGLDHTNISEEIVDVQPRETMDDPSEYEDEAEAEAYEQGSRSAGEERRVEKTRAKVQAEKPKPTLEFSKAHRGNSYRDAMIVMTASGPHWHAVFLDNGEKVVFKRDGGTDPMVEQEVSEREYDDAGGAEWVEGSTYYDGSKVAGVFTKGRVAVLELDSGDKVKLDQWGKEVGRKRVERPPEKANESAEEKPDEIDSEAKLPDDDGSPKGDTEFSKAMKMAEDCSGSSVEDIRKSMIVLLAFWCKNINSGVKISPKTAYIDLVGVAIGEGDKMREEDYRALLETLHEKIQEKAA